MSANDMSLIQQTMPTGLEGVRALERFVKDGNAETRKLLYDESDVILECRYCRNLFRSAINFITHKRTFCKASHVKVTLSNTVGVVDEEGKSADGTVKKRAGLVQALSRRIDTTVVPIEQSPELLTLHTLPRICKELPVTTFEDGIQKIVGKLPCNLARKECIPDKKTCLTMPQDNSSRYQEMTLRHRRGQQVEKLQQREMTSDEMKIIERFTKAKVEDVNFVTIQCEYPACSHVRPFHSLKALAYHCTLKHFSPYIDSDERRFPCLLCGRPLWSAHNARTHLMRQHGNIKEEHVRRREEDNGGKYHKKGKRARSLSSSSMEDVDSEEEEDEEEEGSLEKQIEVKEVKEEAIDDEDDRPLIGFIRRPPLIPHPVDASLDEEAEEDDDRTREDSNSKERDTSITENSPSDTEKDTDEKEITSCVSLLVKRICLDMGEQEATTKVGKRKGRKGGVAKKKSNKGEEKEKRVYRKRGPKKQNSQEVEDDSEDKRVSPSEATVRPSRQRKRPLWLQEMDESHSPVKKQIKEEVDEDAIEIVKEKPAVKAKETSGRGRGGRMKNAKQLNETTPTKFVGPLAEEDPNSSSRKRKQNLGRLANEPDDLKIVVMKEDKSPPSRNDLTTVPVYLSEQQQKLFFSGLKVVTDKGSSREYYKCEYCQTKLPNVRDGRRHMVAHLRVMRLRCGLCGAGAFFCIDMRNHLQTRSCPNLSKAPESMMKPGIPCMTKEDADKLTLVAHPICPGRTLFTSGKIVSIMSKEPYTPNLVIEEKILGPTRVPPSSLSPRKPLLKLMKQSVLKELPRPRLAIGIGQGKESESNEGTDNDNGDILYEDVEDTPKEFRATRDSPPPADSSLLAPCSRAASSTPPPSIPPPSHSSSLPPPSLPPSSFRPLLSSAPRVSASRPVLAPIPSTRVIPQLTATPIIRQRVSPLPSSLPPRLPTVVPTVSSTPSES